MKKSLFTRLVILVSTVANSQINYIDFGSTSNLFICDPPVYTTIGQTQCISNNSVATPAGHSVMYYTTTAGSVGADCRNWLRLANPGFSFIGVNTELQIRNAGNGSLPFNPARFLIKDFASSTKF